MKIDVFLIYGECAPGHVFTEEADMAMRPCRVKRQRRECGILAIKP